MKEIGLYSKFQYQLVQQSRRTLFDYCETISTADFLNQNHSFGHGGSIRNLLVHIASTYEFWIIAHALKKDIAFTEYSAKNSITEIADLFSVIDREMDNFLNKYASSIFDLIELEINGQTKTLSACTLFTHVITHEFHHKGQILSLSRHWGYLPVDTDMIS